MGKELKKDLIADAALSCFLSSGYSGTSMDEIVKASGMSKGGIYWHFRSKDEIFLHIIGKWIDEWDRELMARLKSDGSAKENLAKVEEHYLEKISAPILALIQEFVLQAKHKEILDRLQLCIDNSKRKSVIKNIIQKAVDKGEFKNLDAEAAANVFIGIFEGIGLQWLTQHRDKKLLELTAKTALDIFFEGILNK